MKSVSVQNAHAVTACAPGNHEIPWGRYGGHVCTPDVPGAGLPWDLPTALSAIGCLIFFVLAIVWLIALTVQDWRDR